MATADYIKAGQIIRAPDNINAFNEKADIDHTHSALTHISNNEIIIAYQANQNENLSSQISSRYGGTWRRVPDSADPNLNPRLITIYDSTIPAGSGYIADGIPVGGNADLNSIPAGATVTINIYCNPAFIGTVRLRSNKRTNISTLSFTGNSSFQGVQVQEDEILNLHFISTTAVLMVCRASWTYPSFRPSKNIYEYIYARL